MIADCWLKMASEEARRLASEKDAVEASEPSSAHSRSAQPPQIDEPNLLAQPHTHVAGAGSRASAGKTSDAVRKGPFLPV